AHLNRALARLYEKAGKFTEAISLWEMVHKIDPNDTEAKSKSKSLAAQETIARGQYESAVASASSRTPDSDDEDEGPRSISAPRVRREQPAGDQQPTGPEDETVAEKRVTR